MSDNEDKDMSEQESSEDTSNWDETIFTSPEGVEHIFEDDSPEKQA